jgi:hypothetical protein
VALGVLAITVKAWRTPTITPEIKAALICFAALITTPRVLNYDLHILVNGALFQTRHALRQGFYPGGPGAGGLRVVAGHPRPEPGPGAGFVHWLLVGPREAGRDCPPVGWPGLRCIKVDKGINLMI